MTPLRDGRQIDPEVATLLGEAAGQIAKTAEAAKTPFEVWKENPASLQRAETQPTYYARPLIKAPVWIWSVPAYFYVGGVAGASLALGAASQLLDGSSQDLVHRCRWTGLAGATIGSGLLIYDLGRSSRFFNMFRVFRPTSPMNVGSWFLAATASLSAASVLNVAGMERFNNAAAIAAGLCGIPLSGYTGVLLANTAVPLWKEASRTLPALFVASGMASAGALFHLMTLSPQDEAVTRRFAIVGQAAELVAMSALEAQTSRIESVGKPLRRGVSGFLWKSARILGGACLVLSIFSGKSHRAKRAAGACGTAAALILRFSLLQAGRNSARDPVASFDQQRLAGSKPAGTSLNSAA